MMLKLLRIPSLMGFVESCNACLVRDSVVIFENYVYDVYWNLEFRKFDPFFRAFSKVMKTLKP